jgi:hypothetical protein
MRPLDDILIGFFIFFAIDRLVRLFSNTIVADALRARGVSEAAIENWKMGVEAAVLCVCIVVAWKWRRELASLNKK